MIPLFLVVVPAHRGASLGEISNKCDRWDNFENSTTSARGARTLPVTREERWGWGDLVEFSCRWSRCYAGAGATAKKKGKRDCHHDILLWHDFHL